MDGEQHVTTFGEAGSCSVNRIQYSRTAVDVTAMPETYCAGTASRIRTQSHKCSARMGLKKDSRKPFLMACGDLLKDISFLLQPGKEASSRHERELQGGGAGPA